MRRLTADYVPARVERLLREVVASDVQSEDQDLIESGILDSLLIVQLLVAIEQEFDVQVPPADLNIERLRTIRSISLFVTDLARSEDE
ncbi:MAG: phosphopantetheine-binding protein [Chloroflexota bacterium]|nr:phosphopantetheine-binding protein [Chloroflexota bacterium]